MARGQMSSDIEDTGRKASEKMLPSKQTKYLQDVVEQVETDYKDLLNQVKGHQQAASTTTPFLSSLESLLPTPTEEDEEQPNTTISNIETTLTASRTLLNLHTFLNNSLVTASTDANNYANFLSTRAEEQQRVKVILAAGKRVVQGELVAVEEGTKGEGDGEGEVVEQAIAVFGDGAVRDREDREVGALVKDVLKGVRRMTKGMSDGV